jgi:hypothetical protein
MALVLKLPFRALRHKRKASTESYPETKRREVITELPSVRSSAVIQENVINRVGDRICHNRPEAKHELFSEPSARTVRSLIPTKTENRWLAAIHRERLATRGANDIIWMCSFMGVLQYYSKVLDATDYRFTVSGD